MTLAVPVKRPQDTDIHGNFRYTLRVFLLMRRHNEGGDWNDVVKDVDTEQRHHPDWDVDEKDTYVHWQHWYAKASNL